MPTYQYECNACGHSFEMLQSMTEAKLKECPECNKEELYRLIGTGGGLFLRAAVFTRRITKDRKRAMKVLKKKSLPVNPRRAIPTPVAILSSADPHLQIPKNFIFTGS